MAQFIERATAGAYFSNMDGSVVFDFQFAPHELNFADRSKYHTRMKVGDYRPEFVWISGETKEIELNVFIDRTYGSKTKQDLGVAPELLPINANPAVNPRVIGDSNLATPVKPPAFGEANFKQFASDSSVNPNFPQYANDEESGVYIDFERLRFFLNLSVKRVNRQDLVNGVLTYENRFVPPPMAYFIYGSLWLQGYITDIQYTFSAVNKLLVPKRLDAKIKFIIFNDGLLNPIKSQNSAGASVNQITI